MKLILMALVILGYGPGYSAGYGASTGVVGQGRTSSSRIEITTTWSQNGDFYLKAIPFDNELPSLRGKSSVYRNGSSTPYYVIDRGFNITDSGMNRLILSNDGEVIFFAIPEDANEEKDGLRSINIYRHGALVLSLTASEVTGCDLRKQRCSLIYSNFDQVVDKDKSRVGSPDFKKVLKEGISAEEKFLSDYAIFSADDIVYMTDSKKQVHRFDLTAPRYLGARPFGEMFAGLKRMARNTRTESLAFESPTFLEFPELKGGRNTHEALAQLLGMKVSDIGNSEDYQYKFHRFWIDCTIARDGTVNIDAIDVPAEFPKQKIVDFFKSNRFDISSVPSQFERWYVSQAYFNFRNADDAMARQEKQQEDLEISAERNRRMSVDTINGVYIPASLGECFTELDKELTDVDRQEMKALSKRSDMIEYHIGLGTWMRNEWGLWGGSRLQKYFIDKGISDPEAMSSVILFEYYDWLNGNKKRWKEWEKHPNK